MPRLNGDGSSNAFIASQLWFGDSDAELTETVKRKCFHDDQQGRRIVAVVQSYGCGKTKTCLRLANSFILLPLKMSQDQSTLTGCLINEQRRLREALGVNISHKDMLEYSDCCIRLVKLCLLALLKLYDMCVENNVIGDTYEDRLYFALLLLNDNNLIDWCRNYFEKHKTVACNLTDFEILSNEVWNVKRGPKVIFHFDEVHVLFGCCRGYCAHFSDDKASVAGWQKEQIHNSPSDGHAQCTDLFYQFRLMMLEGLQSTNLRCGFVMSSTAFRTWKILAEENSPLSRGTIEQFHKLHSLTLDEIKRAVLSMFDIPTTYLDMLENAADGSLVQEYCRLSALTRPLFLAEFLECLCDSFSSIPETTIVELEISLCSWLRVNLTKTIDACMERASRQIKLLMEVNYAAGRVTTRHVTELLYTTQRICGGTLELCNHVEEDESILELIISRGVARLDRAASRIRIGEAIFIQALNRQYIDAENGFNAVLETLQLNLNTHHALVSQDSSAKGFLVERALSLLLLSGRLCVQVYNSSSDRILNLWRVSASACTSAGTILEFGLGNTSIDEPDILAAIMSGAEKIVLLPTTMAGPDLFARATVDRVDSIVAVQSKAVNKVYGMKDFKKALASLNPRSMYASSPAAYEKWAEHLPQLEALPYHRIVFNACGFTDHVHYIVREYNLSRGVGAGEGHVKRFIHLTDLGTTNHDLGPLLTSKFDIVPHPIPTPERFMMAKNWRELSEDKKRKMILQTAKNHAKYRDISQSKRSSVLKGEITQWCKLENLEIELAKLDAEF